MVKIATMGDNVVDCYVLRGEMFPGGNCLNVSIFLRRSGVESAYIGRIGKDPAGDLIWDALVAEGVDVSRLGRLDGPTAWCLIGHRDNDRIFLDHDLGVSMFTPSADDLAGLESLLPCILASRAGWIPSFRLRRIAHCCPMIFPRAATLSIGIGLRHIASLLPYRAET